MKFVYFFLALIYLKCILLYKLYNSVSALELKRQARAGNKQAGSLYAVANYEASLDILLWLIGTASGAVLLIWSARTVWWLAAGLIVLGAWLIIWAPAPRWDGRLGWLITLYAKYQAGLLQFLNPVLSRVAALVPPASRVHLHTGLYEKKDLLELLAKQSKQIDNRISEVDLSIAQGAINFGDELVCHVMTPRRKAKLVSSTDSIGPMLMDELHKTGHSRFPVVKDNPKAVMPQIVGTLYLKDIVGYEGSGKVKDVARKDVHFINEDANLRQALSEFLKTHHHLLIVVNNFEELVGVLSIDDVLGQIIGKPIIDESDNDQDLRAVVAKEAERAEHRVIEPEQTSKTVVE